MCFCLFFNPSLKLLILHRVFILLSPFLWQQILAVVPPLLLHPVSHPLLHLAASGRRHRLGQQRLQRAGHLPHDGHRHLSVRPARRLRQSRSGESRLREACAVDGVRSRRQSETQQSENETKLDVLKKDFGHCIR